MNIQLTNYLSLQTGKENFLTISNKDTILKLFSPVFEIDEMVVSDFEYQFSEKTENSWNIIYQTEKINWYEEKELWEGFYFSVSISVTVGTMRSYDEISRK